MKTEMNKQISPQSAIEIIKSNDKTATTILMGNTELAIALNMAISALEIVSRVDDVIAEIEDMQIYCRRSAVINGKKVHCEYIDKQKVIDIIRVKLQVEL